jgi:hypothetical protein
VPPPAAHRPYPESPSSAPKKPHRTRPTEAVRWSSSS